MNKIRTTGILLLLLASLDSSVGAEVLQLATGDLQSVALVTGGDVFEWGEFGGNLPAPVFGIDHIKAISAGSHHVLALKNDGTVWAWGANESGQLGNGNTFKSERPIAVMDVTGAVSVAAGGSQSYALKNDGTVWAWGANKTGQLGDGTSNDRHGPVLVEGLTDVTAIAAGGSLLLALRKNGTVCKAGGGYPQPDCNANFRSAIGVAANDNAAYALLQDGTVRSLGGSTCGNEIPSQNAILDEVHAISAGGAQVLFLRDDGTLWQCARDASFPSRLFGGPTVARLISAGAAHSLAYSDGGIWSWGDNSAGQLGIGNTNPNNASLIWDGTGRLK